MLALLGGAAAASLMGCDRNEVPETTEVAADDDRVTSTKGEPDAPASSATASPTAVGGPTPDESAGVVGPVTRRFPAQGHRSISLSHRETMYYAVLVDHPDARFGDYADQNGAKLLAAADTGVRTVPPYQWRNATERAKTEAAIRDQLQALLAKDGDLTGPLSAVRLDVERIDKQRRRTAGIAPRRDF